LQQGRLPPTAAPRFDGELEQGMAVVVAYTAHKYAHKEEGNINVGLNVVWVAVLSVPNSE